MTPLHACPGGCGSELSQRQLACRRCWFKLPKHLRVNAAYRLRTDGGDHIEHRRAVIAALSWYRDNRPGEAATT